jgi:hypothetical protein
MACCIFVAMIITNILVVYRRFKAMLGLRTDADNDFWKPAPAPPPRYRHWLLPLLLVVTTGFGSYYWDDIRTAPAPIHAQAPH